MSTRLCARSAATPHSLDPARLVRTDPVCRFDGHTFVLTASRARPIVVVMNGAENDLVGFNQRLKVGQRVEARWTNSFHYYSGRAEVTRVNQASARVRLLEPAGDGSYPIGHVLVLPLPFQSGMDRWSHSNGVFPFHHTNTGRSSDGDRHEPSS
jgi:hypothetical protein